MQTVYEIVRDDISQDPLFEHLNRAMLELDKMIDNVVAKVPGSKSHLNLSNGTWYVTHPDYGYVTHFKIKKRTINSCHLND